MFVNLKHRSTEPEIMDDFGLPSAEIDPVLKGLGQVNNLTGNHHSVIKALKALNTADGDTLADWGCGGGEMLIAVAKWWQKNNVNLKLTGIDAAPAAIKFAIENCRKYPNISFKKADVLVDNREIGETDFIISSLFSHHFADEEWVVLIKKMSREAKKGVVITDLHRHVVLYYAVKLITWLTGNQMVKVDGPLSVKRAFKKQELVKLLVTAGIKNYSLRWLWPFRWQIIIYKS